MTDEAADRRALILSGRFGKGHDTVAEATATALGPLGVKSRIVDSIELLGDKGGAAGDWVFWKLLSRPAVYDAFHFSQLRVGGRIARGADRLALRQMYPRFLAEVDRDQPELVVSVFATGAAAAARLKQERPDVRTVVFMTDSYAHRLWVHDGTDLFLVTSTLAARSIRAYRPHARVEVVTGPVRPEFYAAPTRAAARDAVGVPSGERCVLLMTGGSGMGPMAEAAAGLADRGIWVLAVAGNNQRLRARLEEAAVGRPGLQAFGYTERVPELMAAADAVITSSGDTCREARVVGRGLVLLDVVPGHGRENLMHELELGGAAAASADPDLLVEAVEVFLDEGAGDVEPVTSPEAWEHDLRAALATIGVR